MFGIDIPRALFWSVFVYVAFATVIAFALGRPLIRLSFNNEKFNAAFRYALVRLRDAAESIALYRGEKAERGQLRQRFASVVANYKRFVNRTLVFTGWNLSMNHIIIPLPWLLQAPRLFAGQIQLGAVTQSVTAFGAIQDALSFFRNSYDTFAGYRASIMRLHGLVTADTQSRALPQLAIAESLGSVVELDRVEVRNPAGEQLIRDLSLSLGTGEAMIITGESGTGKPHCCAVWPSWPYVGHHALPLGDNETLFLSQLPYVPLGDLRTVVSYPHQPGDLPDRVLRDALLAVALPATSTGSTKSTTGPRCCPRRAATRRVRPRAVDETQGGVSRRSHVGIGRTIGVHDLRAGPARTSRHGVHQRHPPQHGQPPPRATARTAR